MVRAICPSRCSCRSPYPNLAGFFQATSMGCPNVCGIMQDMIIKNADFVCQDFLETYVRLNEKLWSKYVDGMKAYVVSDAYLNTLPMMLERSHKLFNISFD